MTRQKIVLALSVGLLVSGFFQIGFWWSGSAPDAVGALGAFTTLLSAALGWVAYCDAVALKNALSKIENMAKDAGEIAKSASCDAGAALLRRRLSPAQIDAITASLAGADLSGTKLLISYIEAADDAKTFADSLAELLKSLGLSFEWPKPIPSSSIPSHVPEIRGTKIGVSAKADSAAKQLASTLFSSVDEIDDSGLDSHLNWQQDIFAMRIIVGYKP